MWAAAVIPVAAYLVRSIARGWDFGLDLPIDALLGGLLGVLIALALWTRNTTAAEGTEEELPTQVDREHDTEGDDR